MKLSEDLTTNMNVNQNKHENNFACRIFEYKLNIYKYIYIYKIASVSLPPGFSHLHEEHLSTHTTCFFYVVEFTFLFLSSPAARCLI